VSGGSLNKVTLLDNDVIYVQKIGDQTAETMIDLFDRLAKIAAKLRREQKRVLILSNASQEGTTDIPAAKVSATIGTELDYDKSATYGLSDYHRFAREYMISLTNLEGRVANFGSRDEAMRWLLQ
jgi:hypothetical protein